MLLKNKNAVITGCNRGIGKEIVRVFSENGANIWACTRKESKSFTKYINNLGQKHSVKINPVYFDLDNEEQIKTGVKTINCLRGIDKINFSIEISYFGKVVFP